MYDVIRHRRWLIALVLLAVALPGYSDNVTVSGNVTFASLDGSSLDHDGAANGTFTVDDGDLTVLGSINCNDDSSQNACPMNFAVSGNLTVAAGGGLFAENRKGNGVGGNISATVGGNFVLGGTVSSGNLSVDQAGDIAFTAGGSAVLQAGSVISSSSKGSPAGDITIQSGGPMDLRGLIAAGPSSTVTSTKYTAGVLNGGSSNSAGGAITLRSTSHAEPTVSVASTAIIVSQGENAGAETVVLEGCGIVVNGLVASVSHNGAGAKVILRSGTTVSVDGRDLGASGTRLGMLRADSINQGAGGYSANIFARDGVTIQGPASGTLYALNSSGGKTSKDPSGTINVISTEGGIIASGNAAAAAGSNSGDQGGTINLSSRDNIAAATANINASGDFASGDNSRAGGAINVRSYSGSVVWTNGTGDVRPTGSASGVPASQQGTISITYCTTVSTAGTSFPTNGSPVGTFPTVTQTCSPAAPSLPSGESHPDCNDPPIAVNDGPYTVAEGGTLNVAAPGVLTNDVDPDGDPITAILVTGPAHASSFALNADGSFSYVHDGSETTTDSFTYKANDGSLDSNVATVTITITPVNDPPVAVNDSYPVNEGGTLNVAAPGVLANDTDPDGPTAIAILVSGPAHASSFTLNPDGSVVYVHNGSETTSDSFTYRVSDGSLLSNVATVSITIAPVNDAPVANNDGPYSVAEGGTLNGSSVLVNDTDAEGHALTAVLVSGPANASSFTLNANGTFTYVHNGSETTSDSFTYRAQDSAGALSNVATVTITITAVNDAPVANNDGPYTVAEGGTLNGSSVLTNDTDADSPSLTAVLVSGPANASSFTLNADGTFIYVHNGSETTSDSFTYQASDGSALSNVATVSITITAVNDAPVANNDGPYTVAEGGTLNGSSVLANDTDAEGQTLTAVLVSGPANASSFTLNADGTFIYVHNGGETTSDSFTYQASDGSALSNVATVSITITPVNDAPVANNDGPYSVNEGGTLNGSSVLTNDTDVDGPSLTAILVSGPANASSFVLNANGTFTYVHNGSETTSDSFTYKANDGSLDSNVATVTITITPVNDAPVAVNDGPYTVAEGGTFTLPAPGVLANDTDSDSPSFVAVLVTGPAHASSFALNPDGSFTYVHNGNEATSDSFTYRANDGLANSNIATVSITITPVNDAPVAVNDSYSATFGGTLNVPPPGVLGNDTDVDSPTLTAVLVTGPANATSFTLNPDGSFSYQHNGLTPGMDSFTYMANDGSLNSNVATVLINVVSQAPVATDDSYTDVGNTQLRVGTGTGTSPARSIAGSVRDNDTDADTPNALLIISAGGTSTAGGSVSMNPNGTFNYLPPVGFVGSDTFTYTVSDGLNSDTGTVTINVNGRIWYVKNDAAAGDGRSTSPFNQLISAQVASAFGDVIFVHFGNGTSSGQNVGITLQGNQVLIGEGVALTSGADTLWPAGSSPTIGNPGGDVVTLNSGNGVLGVILSASAAGIRGNSVSGGFFGKITVNGGTDAISFSNTGGVFSMSDINLNPSTGSGLLINGGTAVVQISDFHATTTTAGGSAVKINAGGQFKNLAGPVLNTLSSTNAPAVDITGSPTILLSVGFVSINASNGTTGIQMSNTTGSLNVIGDGSLNANGSGGSISNVTSRPVYLLDTAGTVSLSSMNMSLSASALSGMLVDNNAGGAALTVHLFGCAISGANSVSQTKALLQLEGGATANVTANVQGSFFNNSRTYGVFATAVGTSVMNLTVNQSGFGTNVVTTGAVNNPGTVITSPNVLGMAATNGSGGQVNYSVTNNTFWGASGTGYAVTFSSGATTSSSQLVGTFSDNKIGQTGVAASGCAGGCSGIGLLRGTNGTFSATVLNNDIRQVTRGVEYTAPATAAGSTVLKIKGNTLAEPNPVGVARRAISVTTGNSGGTSTTVCAEIGGSAASEKNNVSGAWQAGQFVRLTTANTTGVLTLPGLTPVTGATVAQVTAFVEGNNTGVTGTTSVTIGGAINGGSPCP